MDERDFFVLVSRRLIHFLAISCWKFEHGCYILTSSL